MPLPSLKSVEEALEDCDQTVCPQTTSPEEAIAATSLQALPVEILMHIADCIVDRCDLATFVKASRRIYSATNSVLYRKTLRVKPSGLLHWAAEWTNAATARLALDAGADPNEGWLSGQPRDRSEPPHVRHYSCVSAVACEEEREEHGSDNGPPQSDRGLDPYYWTALHLAAYFGRLNIAELLLDHGAATETPAFGICSCRRMELGRDILAGIGRISATPLHVAICRGQDAIARALLSRGASVQTTFDRSNGHLHMTALHQAAKEGRLRIVKLLLDRGYQSDVDARDVADQTPLHYAATRMRWDIVKVLLEKGADINATFSVGDGGPYARVTVLHSAIHCVNNTSALRLVELGADVQAKPIRRGGLPGPTPLMMVAMQTSSRSTQEVSVAQLVRAIVNRGGDLETQDGVTNNTPLEEASLRHHIAAMRELLVAGAQTRSSLLYACDHRASDWYSGKDAIDLLVEHHADVNEVFSGPGGSRTALHTLCLGRDAADDGHIRREHFSAALDRYDMVSKLVSAGAVPNPGGFRGTWPEPLLRCFRRSEYDIIRLLSEGVKLSEEDLNAMFSSACHRTALDGIEFLLELREIAGLEGYVPATGQSCLRQALIDGTLDLVEAIHSFGILPKETVDGFTPLHQACMHPWIFQDHVKKLMGKGADVNAVFLGQITPLSAAISWRLNWDPPLDQQQGSQLAELLLDSGARWTLSDPASEVFREGGFPIQRAVDSAIPKNRVSYSGFDALERLLAKYPLIIDNDPGYLLWLYSESRARDRPEYLYHGTKLFLAAGVAPDRVDGDGQTALSGLLNVLYGWHAAIKRWESIIILTLAALQEYGAGWDTQYDGGRRIADLLKTRDAWDDEQELALLLRRILSLKRGEGSRLFAVFRRPGRLVGWDTRKDWFLQRLLEKTELWGEPGQVDA